MNAAYERELYYQFTLKHGYTGRNGRYYVTRGTHGFRVCPTARALHQWVSLDEFTLLSQAIETADEWDRQDTGREAQP